jgi:hypothetical protein
MRVIETEVKNRGVGQSSRGEQGTNHSRWRIPAALAMPIVGTVFAAACDRTEPLRVPRDNDGSTCVCDAGVSRPEPVDASVREASPDSGRAVEAEDRAVSTLVKATPLVPHQIDMELRNSAKQLSTKIEHMRADSRTKIRYDTVMEHIRTARFSDGTEMYPGLVAWLHDEINTGMYRGQERGKNIPMQVVDACASMPEVYKLFVNERTQKTAVAIIALIYEPSEEMMARLGTEKGLTREEGEELAQILYRFYKNAPGLSHTVSPLDLSGLDTRIASLLVDFRGHIDDSNPGGTANYDGWAKAGIPNIVEVDRLTKFLLTSSAHGRFAEYGVGPSSTESTVRNEFRLGLADALRRD